jgi:hypothetical protein
MAAPNLAPAFDEFLDYLVSKASPKEILAFRPSEEAQKRADYLTELNKENRLSNEERNELEQLMEFDLLISMLRVKAIAALK